VSLVFADAGYWIALWSRSDGLHRQAAVLAERIVGSKTVTTEFMLIEVLDGFADLGVHGRDVAASLVRELQTAPDVEIVPAGSSLFHAALERYAQRPDQSRSLTDCASFLVMEERGISEALAYDRDFERAGFVALLREQTP
jgi:predicted nucleic acid-binding protein